ncbi:MAG: phosphoglycolate phosphatase [Myxococcales bacterium]|nr:phosphoglycolate phosphatase [Myxococcales bacterium]
MTKRAVLFDLDGTLVDTSRDIAAALNKTLFEYGAPEVSTRTVIAHVGDGPNELVRGVVPFQLRDRTDEITARFLGVYAEIETEHTRPYPGIVEVLDALRRAGTPLGIVTNKPERHTGLLLDKLDWASRFEVVLGVDSVGVRKPDPAILRIASEKIGVPVEDLIMVGDSKQDINAATACGMKCIAVSWGFGDPEALSEAGANLTAENGEELERALLHFVERGDLEV